MEELTQKIVIVFLDGHEVNVGVPTLSKADIVHKANYSAEHFAGIYHDPEKYSVTWKNVTDGSTGEVTQDSPLVVVGGLVIDVCLKSRSNQ
jgi:hypothetical protein